VGLIPLSTIFLFSAIRDGEDNEVSSL